MTKDKLTINSVSVTGMSEVTWTRDKDAEPTKYAAVQKKEGKVFQEEDIGAFNRWILSIQIAVSRSYRKNNIWIKRALFALFVAGYFVYFGYAMYYEFGSEESIRLLWMTCFVVFMYVMLKFNIWSRLYHCVEPCTSKVSKANANSISWTVGLLILVAAITFIIVDALVISKQPYNLVSGCGICIYMFLVLITSANPARVNWRTVLWGINLQLLLALILLRWHVGFTVMQWLSDRFVTFVNYTIAGAEFAFGKSYLQHWFVFKAMPVVVFMSSIIAVLYHLGVMQRVIQIIGWILQKLMGTTAAESMAAAGNIFVGNVEAPLLILPMIEDMTKSELHCLMVGGFATIAGSAFGVYVALGAKPIYLITASVMSAPAAMALAKLSYPETEESKTTVADFKALRKSPYRNIIEAASSGSIQSIKIVACIVVTTIAFLAILEFINDTLAWLGHRVGLYEHPLSFGLICSYLLFPFALSMGVELEYCRKVAEILGVNSFISVDVAYRMLGILRSNTETFNQHILNNGTYQYVGDNIILFDQQGSNSTLVNGILSERSLAIATFSLCGFATIGSMGLVLGSLTGIIPNRKGDLSQLIIRATIVGNVVSFMTACFAANWCRYQARFRRYDREGKPPDPNPAYYYP